jgi:ubiquinone/menaquinone biosynthesis C-methylase UbiE
MSIFRWTAPLFKLASRRWSDDDFQTLADRLRPGVEPGGVFADLGGGTGDLGAGVARALGARVVVIDPVRQMLQRVPADPLVSVRLAQAESLPFPSGYFDALLCCDALHHFRDQGAAVREVARVVKPGGAVLILDAEATGAYRVAAVIERMLGEPAAFRDPEDLREFLAANGIAGATTHQRGGNYLFAGSVRSIHE